MKRKDIVPSKNERKMRDGDFIVSKTDTKGIITYGNPIFIEFSGYSEEELIGTQHNIIRHPDMPRSAFALAWRTIQAGKEFVGFVKNMSKDGGFYWVFAHISPDFDESGRICGYTSVRRKPSDTAIKTVEPVYELMLKAEKEAGSRDAISAGTAVLLNTLKSLGVTYEELVFSLVQ